MLLNRLKIYVVIVATLFILLESTHNGKDIFGYLSFNI